jgi:hypothetical protein
LEVGKVVACLVLLEDRVGFPYRLEEEMAFPFHPFLEEEVVVEAVTCHSSYLVVGEVEVASPFLPCQEEVAVEVAIHKHLDYYTFVVPFDRIVT